MTDLRSEIEDAIMLATSFEYDPSGLEEGKKLILALIEREKRKSVEEAFRGIGDFMEKFKGREPLADDIFKSIGVKANEILSEMFPLPPLTSRQPSPELLH